MIVGIPTETFPGERRVALVPSSLAFLRRAGIDVLIESGCGSAAGFADEAYVDKGATVAGSRKELFAAADVIAQVRGLGANPEAGRRDLTHLKKGQVLIGHFEPLTSLSAAEDIAGRGATQFAMELIPRITRAQSMDVLSSMATVAGYKAVLIAADRLPKLFPMMMTAAGTIAAAKVLVIGAGVAGLQAIATARRLGAIVSGYDVRAAVKEQINSLGAKFVEMDLGTGDAESKGGYAKALGDDVLKRQQQLMDKVVSESDVVICTAAVPGRKAPIIVTREMVSHMEPGSVIVDLAAERGGNCEGTIAGEETVVDGVTIVGPVNLPTALPFHASQMYSKNIQTFLLHMIKKGELTIDTEDEITRGTLLTRDGAVVHENLIAQAAAGGDKSTAATASTASTAVKSAKKAAKKTAGTAAKKVTKKVAKKKTSKTKKATDTASKDAGTE